MDWSCANDVVVSYNKKYIIIQLYLIINNNKSNRYVDLHNV